MTHDELEEAARKRFEELYCRVRELEDTAAEARGWRYPHLVWAISITFCVMANQCAHGVWG